MLTPAVPYTLRQAEHLKSILKKEHNFSPKIVVDQMTNRLSRMFAAHPERLAVLLDGKIIFIGGKGPFNYSVSDIENFLLKFK